MNLSSLQKLKTLIILHLAFTEFNICPKKMCENLKQSNFILNIFLILFFDFFRMSNLFSNIILTFFQSSK